MHNHSDRHTETNTVVKHNCDGCIVVGHDKSTHEKMTNTYCSELSITLRPLRLIVWVMWV